MTNDQLPDVRLRHGRLTITPLRTIVPPEAEELGRPLRHLLYGRRTGVYRIIFDIQEDSEEGPRVRVLRIWRAVRDTLTAEDIELEH